MDSTVELLFVHPWSIVSLSCAVRLTVSTPRGAHALIDERTNEECNAGRECKDGRGHLGEGGHAQVDQVEDGGETEQNHTDGTHTECALTRRLPVALRSEQRRRPLARSRLTQVVQIQTGAFAVLRVHDLPLSASGKKSDQWKRTDGRGATQVEAAVHNQREEERTRGVEGDENER